MGWTTGETVGMGRSGLVEDTFWSQNLCLEGEGRLGVEKKEGARQLTVYLLGVNVADVNIKKCPSNILDHFLILT